MNDLFLFSLESAKSKLAGSLMREGEDEAPSGGSAVVLSAAVGCLYTRRYYASVSFEKDASSVFDAFCARLATVNDKLPKALRWPDKHDLVRLAPSVSIYDILPAESFIKRPLSLCSLPL